MAAHLRSAHFPGTTDHISSIPPELLASIFQLAQEPDENSDDDDGDKPPNPNPTLIPVEVTASHVSIYWRNVALSTRILWRHINIDQSERVEKVRVYLSRSGQSLLHVRLDLRRHPLDITALTEKVDLVFSHLDHWGRLTIRSLIETVDLPVVSRLYDALAPSLEHLGLWIEDVDSEILKTFRRADFEQILTRGCPRLSVLRLRGLSMHFFRPPLTNVTTLHLEQTRGIFMGYRRFTDLLTASPALAHLSIHDTIIDEWEETWPSDSVSCIPVPNLVSLRLAIPGTLQHTFSDILISIYAPRLASLVLKEMGELHLDRFLKLPGVASKFPVLRSLTLCEFDYQSVERLAMMSVAFPGITDFTSLNSFPPKILNMMKDNTPVSIAGSLVGPPWPKLETLSMSLGFVDQLELVRDAMECRQRIGYPLRLLRIPASVFDEVDEDLEEDLDWLEDNMQVEPITTMYRWPLGSEYDPDDVLFK